jgi:translation initiation factor IF-1
MATTERNERSSPPLNVVSEQNVASEREGFSQAASVTGVVADTLPSAMYRVRLDEGGFVTAHVADRIDRNFVRLVVGDRVRLELSPIDLGRGRIVERLG